MKMLFMSIVLGISFSASSSLFDSCQKENQKWFECEKDHDCVVISNPCGHPTAAASKRFSKEAETCNIHKGAALSCASWSDMGGGKTQAFCKNKICYAEKISTKTK